MFQPDLFQKQIYCIEESTCDIFGTIQPPAVFPHLGNCAPLSPLIVTQHFVLEVFKTLCISLRISLKILRVMSECVVHTISNSL